MLANPRTFPVEFTLSEDHALHANGELGEPLNFDSEQENIIQHTLDLNYSTGDFNMPGLFAGALDTDASSKLSIGDVIIMDPEVATPGGNSPTGFSVDYYRLTADDINALEQAGIPVDPVSDDSTPPTGPVSAGGVSIGENYSPTPIPNDKIVLIRGQLYTVGFLKQQVEDFANSSYAGLPAAVAAVNGVFPWGVSNDQASGNRFESYIADNFPQGEADLAASTLQTSDSQQSNLLNQFGVFTGPDAGYVTITEKSGSN